MNSLIGTEHEIASYILARSLQEGVSVRVIGQQLLEMYDGTPVSDTFKLDSNLNLSSFTKATDRTSTEAKQEVKNYV